MNTEGTISQTQGNADSSYMDVLKTMILAGAVAFVIGWVLSIIASITVNYYEIPTMGEMRTRANGTEYFHAYYPDFRDYAVKTEDSPYGTELSIFEQMGYLATGLYIYSISNAYHWMLELKMSNFGIIILFPLFCIAGIMIIAYLKWIPKIFQKGQYLVPMTMGVSVIHTILLLLFIAVFSLISPAFESVYSDDFVYSGQILGTMVPSAFIILSTNLFYGAVAGAVLLMLVNVGLLPENKE